MPVLVDRDGPVTIVTLSRPDARNPVDRPHADALADAFRAFERDDAAKVAILYGAGGTFCAGADLKAMGSDRGNRVAEDGDGPMGPTRMQLDKPVVAAISGYAVAGGLELACWCDLRVVEKSAQLGVFCRRWGVPLIDGGTIRLPRLVGLSVALDLILTGRAVGAEEALRLGLANRVVDDGRALEAAKELAHAIAAFPQECMRNDRRSAYEQANLSLEDALRNELAHGMRSLASPELFDALGRFLRGEGRHGRGV